ncbi:hypothetical protein [uncultured Cohaesibacter sp.]|nr:hypothetical protein [uncultured Cohaesibacter sp.]
MLLGSAIVVAAGAFTIRREYSLKQTSEAEQSSAALARVER